MIRDGLVFVGGKPIDDVSTLFDEVLLKDSLRVLPQANYVSRGALKLIPALEYCKIAINDKICLDLGISTGGFSEVLLERGAQRVFGVDVGSGQLSEKLIGHPRLTHFENTNARHLQPSLFPDKFDLVVMDVSFISVALVLPVIPSLVNFPSELLVLVKPQFELERSALNKKGIVKTPEHYREVESKIRQTLTNLRYKVQAYFPSSLKGGDGNMEFFCYALITPG